MHRGVEKGKKNPYESGEKPSPKTRKFGALVYHLHGDLPTEEQAKQEVAAIRREGNKARYVVCYTRRKHYGPSRHYAIYIRK